MKHNIKIGDVFKTNSYGEITILEKKEKGYFLVRFNDTGYTVTANRGNIIAGKVRDTTKLHHCTVTEWVDVNLETVSNSGAPFVILQRMSRKAKIVFTETKHFCVVEYQNALQGKVKDPYAKSVYGVGYLGEKRNVTYIKQAKQLWNNMMKRCYSTVDERGYSGEVDVDARWLCFSNFVDDLPKLENFDNWLSSKETGVKFNLDKDLIIPNNKTYSVESCSFVQESLNKGATSRNNYYR